MGFNLEKEIVLLMEKYVEEKPRLIDTYKSKIKDHRRRHSRLRKKNKAKRREYYRSFRAKSKNFCRKNLKTKIEEIDGLVEPVFKRTSGWRTW